MNQHLSTEVLAALLRVSSTPFFAQTLALASAKRPRQQLIPQLANVTKRSKQTGNA
jgi:hypothetical protein